MVKRYCSDVGKDSLPIFTSMVCIMYMNVLPEGDWQNIPALKDIQNLKELSSVDP